MTRLITAVAAAGALLLAAFFLFVGYHKALSPPEVLAKVGAWTVWLPGWLGRLVGWSEMACAAGLLVFPWARARHVAGIAAGLLIANQAAAASVHFIHGEMRALPQNAVLILLLALVAFRSLRTAKA